MPRRSILSPAERDSLFSFPDSHDDLIRHYTFSEQDMSLIRQHRGTANRLGFAVQFCCLRFPGFALSAGVEPPPALLRYVAGQLGIAPSHWEAYAQRDQTRREHLLELQAALQLRPLTVADYHPAVLALVDLAMQTDKGFVLAQALLEYLRRQAILLPGSNVIERICAEAVTRATRRIHDVLTELLSDGHRRRLDELLKRRDDGRMTWLAWLRLPPGKASSRQMLQHIDRLKILHAVDLPAGLDRLVHRNRLLKIAREGAQMTPHDLGKFETQRRHATLAAIVMEATATVTDEIVDLHDRIIGRLFNAAKKKHQQQFHRSGKAINDKVRLYGKLGRALLKARENGGDAFKAIESVMSWEVFTKSVSEAEQLAQPEAFDFLHQIGDHYATLRRYVPAFLEILKLRAAPAATDVLNAVNMIKAMDNDGVRKMPADAPTAFVKPRWKQLVLTDTGIDRRYYELCALAELKNALRSGDIWVQGSRQFKDFDDYLLPAENFQAIRRDNALPIPITTDCDRYLNERRQLLEERLATVNRLAAENGLPDAIITESGLKITPLDAAVPEAAQTLIDQTSVMLPRVKITELLMEVDAWTGFTRHFMHLKTGESAKDKTLLLTTVLADAINLGLTKMAEACPGTTYAKLSWLQAWHIRDETYSQALGELVNAQFAQPFATHWGDGSTSSSDGQRFRAGGRAESTGHVNPKYGAEPGRMFYTHISDQYAPFYPNLVNVGVRDSTYVLDGLLYHESDLRIQEHYTDTNGFTDHVFALMHLLGFRFAPRIRDLHDMKLYVPGSVKDYPALQSMIGDTYNEKAIRRNWDEILRLATSIRQGTVTASLMLRKLGSYPRQNGLAVALREIGRIERTLFILDWLQNVELRRRVHVGLNKGEARNALARSVFFYRLGEIRDRSFESQRYRASGLNLVTAAIVLWNTVYLDRAVHAMVARGTPPDAVLLPYLSPLGWEHINLTGDYVWREDQNVRRGGFRPLRPARDH
ncbi:tn3 transposase DDE domain protein [Paraburkholderia fungorum]|jgi:TnpA family transposase|uniref:Tn3 family transposase n=3 Tax=Burkholderiaceae TaxID=119060 RepID=A0AAP1L6M1_9BURK|nr:MULTISPECIES: Tn3 family transposase [Pseudomonadota]AJZ56902.1 tn3 transposase DDE domain protein [Paraburkholderia fungorum]MBB4519922.1 TnpA family transposase [Paraburkholderia fungorum]MBB6206189.1 TnpA family transposase [Paraburkholderia fungorum]MDT8843255.1 Tn3 family transposase [Paraburkholderia fungorum]PRZ42125.1 TnpA family transposase [Paraburkholderia fungorum]